LITARPPVGGEHASVNHIENDTCTCMCGGASIRPQQLCCIEPSRFQVLLLIQAATSVAWAR
jgi:hypothetical protein